ncbi:MAG: ATP-binding protein [Bacteroidaceae bacterium]|nr:ATP-binding protein [Bacteroidaceae bacterium]
MAHNNPFPTQGYAGAEFFCDRVEETEMLTRYLTNGNDVLLISPRRIGKTGLIEHCFHQTAIKENYITVVVDIYATKNLQDFVFAFGSKVMQAVKPMGRKVWEQLLAVLMSIRSNISFDINGTPEWSLGLGDIKNPSVTLDEIFQFIEKAPKPCLVAIDEFQQIAKYPEKNVEAILRTYIQKMHNARFVFAGSQRHLMGEMFMSPSRPFYMSTSPLTLRAIDIEKYYEFAEHHFSADGKHITREAFDRIYHQFEGITWYVQFTLNMAYGMISHDMQCDETLVDRAIQQVLQTFSTVFENMLYQLPFKQKEVLVAIAREGKAENVTAKSFLHKYSLTASSVQAALKGLLEKDFITQHLGSYQLSDKFFALWLLQE